MTAYPRNKKAWFAQEYQNVKVLLANGYIREEVGQYSGRSPSSITGTLGGLEINIDELLAGRGLSKIQIMQRRPLPEFCMGHVTRPVRFFVPGMWLTARAAEMAAVATKRGDNLLMKAAEDFDDGKLTAEECDAVEEKLLHAWMARKEAAAQNAQAAESMVDSQFEEVDAHSALGFPDISAREKMVVSVDPSNGEAIHAEMTVTPQSMADRMVPRMVPAAEAETNDAKASTNG